MLCGWWFLKGGCLVISPLNLFQDFCYSQLLFWIDYHYFLWRKLAGKCPPVWGHGPKSHFFWASWLVTFKDVQPFGWVGRSCISAWLLKHLVFYLWFKYSFLLCSANICTSLHTHVHWEALYLGCRRALALIWEAAPPIPICSQLYWRSWKQQERSAWGAHELAGRTFGNFRTIHQWFLASTAALKAGKN